MLKAMPMQKAPLLAVLAVTGTLGLTGCATTTGTDAAQDNRTAETAPLGSRIKRRSDVSPILGATREDLENAKMQQNARQAGAVNNPGKYGQ